MAATIFALFFTLNTRAANERTATNRRGHVTQKHRIPALPLTAIALLTVGMVTLLESLILEPWSPTFSDPPPILIWWVFASAVIGTAGRFLLQTYAQSLATQSHGAVILILKPVWVSMFAAGWFGETMTPIQLAGCGLIFAALIVNRWSTVTHALKIFLKNRRAVKNQNL